MAGFQCPNCQCEISLADASVKRLSAATAWFCLGGLIVAVIAGLGVPRVGPKPPDPQWVDEVRESHKDDPGKAEEIIRQRQADDYKNWQAKMTVAERDILDLRSTVRGIGILMLCMGVPAGVLAISIKPQPLQKRPPPKPQ